MKKLIIGGVTCLIIGTAVITPPIEVTAQASSNSQDDRIKELEKEKDKLEAESKKKKKAKSKAEKKIEENIERQIELEAEMEVLDLEVIETEEKVEESLKNIKDTEKKIQDVNTLLAELQEEIDILNAEMEVIQERIDIRSELVGSRLSSVQQNGGDISYIEVLFGSKSFSDFLSRAAVVKTILKQDEQLIGQQLADKQIVEDGKKKVERNKREITRKKRNLEKREQALNEEKEELLELQETLRDVTEEKEKLMSKLESEQDSLISEQVKAQQEEVILQTQAILVEMAIERQKENPNTELLLQYSLNNEDGILVMPAIGRHSSPYGVRSDPFTKAKRIHAGMDIAGPTGTPIIASGTGIVTNARYMGGFGNVVFIYHPHFNLTTVYAHLSKIHVKTGEEVEVGEHIADMGNTGRSTGPHLHFEVHPGQYKHGNAIDPLIYLK